jgi:hypothetical protein
MLKPDILTWGVIEPKRLEFPKFWVEHIPFAFYLVEKLRPSVVVELGAHSGNSFFSFCQAAQENNLSTICYAIDTWLGDKHTGHYYEDVYESVVKHAEENYKNKAILLRMTFDEALKHFAADSIDLLNIDGLHTYGGVKQDFENWLPKLSERGIVLFHDTQIKMKGFGVWRFWSEISKEYPSFEFKHGCGLGVLAVGKDVPENVGQFIKDANSNNEYKTFFEQEGKRVYRAYRKLQFRRNVRAMFFIHRIIVRRLKRMFS